MRYRIMYALLMILAFSNCQASAVSTESVSLSNDVLPTTIGTVAGKPVMMREGKPVLFYGIQYWGLDDWNKGNWEKDLQEIKTLGFNGIRLNIAWDIIEPQEGQFNFSRLDALLDLIDEHKLMVYLQLNQSAHSWKPQWFIDKYKSKDIYVFDEKGKRQYARSSFSSPYMKEYYTNYVTKTIEHVKNRACIAAYSVYTEPHFAEKEQFLDYNKHNIKAFRKWLAERYHNDIAQLNAAWSSSFKSFDAVKPYKNTPSANWEELDEKKKFADWRIWNVVAKARFISGVIASARKIDNQHLYGQNMMWKWSGKYFNNVSLDPEINYDYADIIGINVYPLEKNTEKMGNSVSFIRTLHNNKKIVWLGEMNAKPGNASKSTLKNFLEPAFDAGCTGFVYFTYNGNADGGIEQYGVKLDNERKASFDELQKYIEENIKGYEDDILNRTLAAPRAYMLWPFANKYVTYYDEDYVLDQHTALRTMLYKNYQIEIEVLTEKRFLSGDYDANLPLIIPSMPVTDVEVAEKLKSDIEVGARVLIVGRFGEFLWEDDAKCTKRGYGVKDEYLPFTFNSVSAEKAKVQVLTKFYKINPRDKKIKVGKDKVLVTPPADATVLAKWKESDSPALFIYPQGEGRVMYYGTHLFVWKSTQKSDFNNRLLKSFIEWCEDGASIDK